MKYIVLFLILCGSILPASATDFQCRVEGGVYKPQGESILHDVGQLDKSLVGEIFFVTRETGVVVGNNLLGNEGEQITILRNIDEVLNSFEVMSMNAHSDVKVLDIFEFKDKLTFKYYFGYPGLLVIGPCIEIKRVSVD
jgi:hypothetical protein